MNIVSYLTPSNLAAEREKFFASTSYNPIFSYEWNLPENTVWAAKHPRYNQLTTALREQDLNTAVAQAEIVFDTRITPELTRLAQELTTTCPPQREFIPHEKVISLFDQAFQELGLDEYTIETVDQHGFNFRPSARNKKIVMSKYMNMEFFDIPNEVRHELVHIVRYENGKYNRIPANTNYLPTEEGLACYCQDYAPANGESSLFQHAAEYAVTEVALQSSLRQMVEYLQDLGFSAELAWQRAARHKYGWVNTAEAGDIMKPAMYFYHQQLVKDLTNDERYRLFVGKIAQNQLVEFPEYTGRVSLEKLQSFFQFRNA